MTRQALLAIVAAYESFIAVADKMGWDKNSLEDFIGSIAYYLNETEEKNGN